MKKNKLELNNKFKISYRTRMLYSFIVAMILFPTLPFFLLVMIIILIAMVFSKSLRELTKSKYYYWLVIYQNILTYITYLIFFFTLNGHVH